MEEAQTRIDAAEAVITKTQESLGIRANQMYRQGPLSFLEVLFGATTFQEFTSTWDLLNAINEENARLIKTNQDARTEAETARDEYAAQADAAARHLAEVEQLKANAEQLYSAQEAELAALSADIAAIVFAEQQERQAEVINNNQGPQNNYDAPPVPNGGYSDVVAAAQSRLGCPYYYGGTGPDLFDCSGFTSWCYSQAGRGYIGRGPADQYNMASARWPYTAGGAQPGDVLWWPPHTGYTHVAIYVGGGQYIHAPLPGQTVCYSSWGIEELIVLRF
jgi:cell wall-associated NlpC family hydrolase